MSLSRTNFLNNLKTVDYIKFGNISADWNSIVEHSESVVKQHPEYWNSSVTDEFNSWDNTGNKYHASLTQQHEWGYCKENTRSWTTTSLKEQLHMPWEEEVSTQLPLDNWISRPTMQPPGQVMPWHLDHFFYFKRKYPDNEYVVRFVIFMRDWQSGHVLQAGDSIISHWSAGDVILWHPERMHLSANIGYNNKWTINTTGILKENFKYENINIRKHSL